MRTLVHRSGATPVRYAEYDYIPLLGAEHGCTAGCRTGLLMYTQEEFRQGGVHDDQEGFYVLEGTGAARVGDQEFPLSPGACFIVPPGQWHSIRKDASCDRITLFFFHAAAH